MCTGMRNPEYTFEMANLECITRSKIVFQQLFNPKLNYDFRIARIYFELSYS